MKKNGFTLAEVLITLAIIGIVATLTLPALMQNTQEQQYAAALRKGVNTLTEAAAMNAATNQIDYNDLPAEEYFGSYGDSLDPDGKTIASIVGLNANVETSKSTTDKIVFKDGTSIVADNAVCTARPSAGITTAKAILFDANGDKGPNKAFTCTTDCKIRKNRVIGDQFILCLGGQSAYPQSTEATSPAQYFLYGSTEATGTTPVTPTP